MSPEPVVLTQPVPTDYLAAVQGIAALEQRITDLRSWPGDFTPEIAASHRLLAALRSTFGVRLLTEAQLFDPADGSPDPVPAECESRALWGDR